MPKEEPLESFTTLKLVHESKHGVFVVEFKEVLNLGARFPDSMRGGVCIIYDQWDTP